MGRKQWVDPRKTKRRCWIRGCLQFGQWIAEPDGYREGSHYDRNHANDPRAESATQAEMDAYDAAHQHRRAG